MAFAAVALGRLLGFLSMTDLGSVVTFLTAAMFAVWFAVSILNQFENGRWVGPLKDRDVAALIPNWTFFAPRPGTSDFELIYRDLGADGGVGPWRVAPSGGDPRWRFIWRPAKRREKLITDCVVSFLPEYDPASRAHLLGLPYLLLLALIEAEPGDFRAVSRQFGIVAARQRQERTEAELLFLSDFVSVARERGL